MQRIENDLTVLLVILLTACEKDVPVIGFTKCEDLPDDINIIYQKFPFVSASTVNTSRDIVYFIENYEDGSRHLYKANLLGSDKVLLDSNFYLRGEFSSNSKGVIAFIDKDFRLKFYNTFDKTILTTTITPARHPKWADDSILYVEHSQKLGYPFYLCKVSKSGNIIDTIDTEGYLNGTFIPSKGWVFSDQEDYSDLLFYNGKERVKIVDGRDDPDSNIFGLCWSKKQNRLYYSRIGSGIYSYSFENGRSELVVRSCASKAFTHLSISSDENHLLARREIYSDYNNESSDCHVQEVLTLINLQTLEVLPIN